MLPFLTLAFNMMIICHAYWSLQIIIKTLYVLYFHLGKAQEPVVGGRNFEG